MVVGLALSGGGVTACVCTLCLLDALGPLGPDVVVSTVSGGTLGYLLHVNAPRFKNLTYPETGPNATYESLREARANDGEAWFAQIVREIPDGSRASAARAARRGRDAPGAGRAAADARRCACARDDCGCGGVWTGDPAYCAPWLEPGFRASVPRELYETLPPRAQFRCARIVGDVDARLVDELRTPYIFGARPAPPPAPPRARRGFVARVLGCARRDAARTHKTV